MDSLQRDEWWRDAVLQVGVPQLTLRALLAGFLCGGALSLTNLYVSAKAGVTFGMGLTASIVAFAFFRLVASAGGASRLHVLENNIVQTVAGAAGYMASAFTASLAAFMVMQNQVIPWWQAASWCVALSLLGLLVAIPQKRRFVNNLDYPFPEGQACGVVLAALHECPIAKPPDVALNGSTNESGPMAEPTSSASKPLTALAMAVAASGIVKVLQSPRLMRKLGLPFLHIPEMLDDWYYHLAVKFHWTLPQLLGVPLRELTIRPSLDLAMLAVGGLMGFRLCLSLLFGALVNYAILAPWMIQRGDIAAGIVGQVPAVGFRAISSWSVWAGVAMLTAATVTGLLVYWFTRAPRPNWKSSETTPLYDHDPLAEIEIPMWWFWAGLVVIIAAVVVMAHQYFDVSWVLAVAGTPLALLLATLGIHATALTSITPTGAMARVSQVFAGIVAPRQPSANVVLGAITAETTMHASTFCQHLRPGYMLGANPRAQAMGHVVGTFAGVAACVPVFYLLFLRGDPQALIGDAYPFPAASVWLGVTQMLTGGLSSLPVTARTAAVVAAVSGVILSLPVSRPRWFPFSPIGMSLAFLIPFHISLAIFAGGLVLWLCERAAARSPAGICQAIHLNREAVCRRPDDRHGPRRHGRSRVGSAPLSGPRACRIAHFFNWRGTPARRGCT